MAYRKMTIDTETYQYSVGRSHVHIKGGKLRKPLVFSNVDVGEKIEWRCDCCGLTMSEIGYQSESGAGLVAVTPSVVRGLVLAHLQAA